MSDALLSRKDVSPGAKLVLMALQRYGRDGNLCFPSNEKLAEDTGLSAATVKRVLPELAAHKLIEIVTGDPRTPKGRRIDKTWMDDPSLHPPSAGELPLEGQIDPLGRKFQLTLDLEGQIDPRPRGSICTHPLEGQNDPQEKLLETIRETTKTAESSSSSLSVHRRDPGAEPERPELAIAVERARKLFPETNPEIIANKARRACEKDSVEEFLKAIQIAEQKQPRPNWGFVNRTLENGRAEGGLIVPPIRQAGSRDAAGSSIDRRPSVYKAPPGWKDEMKAAMASRRAKP